MSRTKVDVNVASKLYLIQVQFLSAALLINMVSIPILLRISTHRGHVLVVFLNARILYLNTHEMYLIWSHLFAESYDSNSDINAPFRKWSCKFKFHGVLQKYHKWSNKFTYSLKTLYKSWFTVLVQKMFIFITTSPVLMITIQQFYVPANCRKEVYSDEIKLVTGGVSVHLNSECQKCN